MADGHLEFRVTSNQGGREWRALSAKLRAAKAVDLRKNLRKTIAAAGKPVVADVQRAVRSLHVTSSHGGGGKRRQLYNSLQAARRAQKSGKDVRAAAARAAKRSTELRGTIASATKLQIVTKGVRIYVDSKRLPESQWTLPRRLDSDKGWSHPVFGNRSKWVDQKGGPWFASTIQKRAPQFRSAIAQAMEDTKTALEQ